MYRKVVDGERLSGHGDGHEIYPEDYPTISVLNGQGPGGGALMFEISSFHWVEVGVSPHGKVTVLNFEGRTSVAFIDAVVMYADGYDEDAKAEEVGNVQT